MMDIRNYDNVVEIYPEHSCTWVCTKDGIHFRGTNIDEVVPCAFPKAYMGGDGNCKGVIATEGERVVLPLIEVSSNPQFEIDSRDFTHLLSKKDQRLSLEVCARNYVYQELNRLEAEMLEDYPGCKIYEIYRNEMITLPCDEGGKIGAVAYHQLSIFAV